MTINVSDPIRSDAARNIAADHIDDVEVVTGEGASRRTVTRSDLAEALFRKIGLSRQDSAQLVESVIEEISEALLRGENVKLSGFGTFNRRAKRERIGRNPKTGVEAKITPRTVLVFKASHIMRDRVNEE